MKILIIGGTRFLGRHLVSAALTDNHNVTVFHRGTTESNLAGNVEVILGNRDFDLAKLSNEKWDLCIDTCGYHPNQVQTLVDVIREKVDRYVFISSISVYSDVSVKGVDESAPLEQLTETQLEKANAIAGSGEGSAFSYGEMYGGLKALCETTAEQMMTGRVAVIRPGLIVGAYDYTDRFTYWVTRIANGGEVLLPSPPTKAVQIIDVRDLAEWIIKLAESGATGIFNATGLPGGVSMETFISECKSVSGSDAEFTWVDEEFLSGEGVKAWSELPLWLPESAASHAGFMFVNIDKALSSGLKFRPLGLSIRDTLAWIKTERDPSSLKAGINPERERQLLNKWHART